MELPSLPDYCHIPGVNQRPENSFLEEIAHAAPNPTKADEICSNTAFVYGIELIRNGFFWEAHEVLEPVWYHCPPNSRERALLQGLIQLANGALKIKMERPSAAERLLRIAGDHFREARPAQGLCLGFDVASLIDETHRLLANCVASGSVEIKIHNMEI